jgi:hypothetical protein
MGARYATTAAKTAAAAGGIALLTQSGRQIWEQGSEGWQKIFDRISEVSSRSFDFLSDTDKELGAGLRGVGTKISETASHAWESVKEEWGPIRSAEATEPGLPKQAPTAPLSAHTSLQTSTVKDEISKLTTKAHELTEQISKQMVNEAEAMRNVLPGGEKSEITSLGNRKIEFDVDKPKTEPTQEFGQQQDAQIPKPAPTMAKAPKAPEGAPLAPPEQMSEHAPKARLEIEKHGVIGSIRDWMRANPQMAEKLGVKGEVGSPEFKDSTAQMATKIWFNQRADLLKNPEIQSELGKLGYKNNIEGLEQMMRRIQENGEVLFDPSTGKIELDADYLKAPPPGLERAGASSDTKWQEVFRQAGIEKPAITSELAEQAGYKAESLNAADKMELAFWNEHQGAFKSGQDFKDFADTVFTGDAPEKRGAQIDFLNSVDFKAENKETLAKVMRLSEHLEQQRALAEGTLRSVYDFVHKHYDVIKDLQDTDKQRDILQLISTGGKERKAIVDIFGPIPEDHPISGVRGKYDPGTERLEIIFDVESGYPVTVRIQGNSIVVDGYGTDGNLPKGRLSGSDGLQLTDKNLSDVVNHVMRTDNEGAIRYVDFNRSTPGGDGPEGAGGQAGYSEATQSPLREVEQVQQRQTLQPGTAETIASTRDKIFDMLSGNDNSGNLTVSGVELDSLNQQQRQIAVRELDEAVRSGRYTVKRDVNRAGPFIYNVGGTNKTVELPAKTRGALAELLKKYNTGLNNDS